MWESAESNIERYSRTVRLARRGKSQGQNARPKYASLRLGYRPVFPTRSRRKASSQAAHNGGRSICTMSPKPVLPDGIVFVAQAVSKRPHLIPWLTRHEGRGQIAKFSRGFANPFEAALHRIVSLLVFLKRCHVHTGDITLNSLRVFNDVFQAAGGFIRRQGRGPGRSLFENVSCAPALR
jgi:hypothetical protein